MALYLVTVNRESKIIVEVPDGDQNPRNTAAVTAKSKLECPEEEEGYTLRDHTSTRVERLVQQPLEG